MIERYYPIYKTDTCKRQLLTMQKLTLQFYSIFTHEGLRLRLLSRLSEQVCVCVCGRGVGVTVLPEDPPAAHLAVRTMQPLTL